MIRKALVVVLVTLMASAFARAEVTPEDLIKAVDRMSPAEAYDLVTKIKAKVWKPMPEGFFYRAALGLDVAVCELDDVELTNVRLSADDLDLETVSGTEISLLWRVFSPRFRLGVKGGSALATDSLLTADGYSRADIATTYRALAANYQVVRSDHCLIWGEAAAGTGGISMEVVDTPAGSATTLRSFDGDFAMLDLRGGISWRFNPVLSFFLSGGYRFADDAELNEGGVEAGPVVKPGGGGGQLGLGVNF